MIIEALKKLSNGENLDFETTKLVMQEITQGSVTDIQITSFLTALRIKGETVEEITAAAKVMKEKCIKTTLDTENTIDIVGTGGDMSNTFNISTTSAFVVAAGGVPVAKHGNRALTSKSGAIDVLEALGINVNRTTNQEKEIFNKLNICFMFAQNHHPAMKYVANVRKELKFRTLFNILGPLTNPANANSQLFGVFDEKLTSILCQVILNLGVKRVLVIHGKDGLDEATLTDETVVSEGLNGKINNYTIKPEDFNLKRCNLVDIQGGSAKDNAEIIKNIFNLKETGAKRDIVILNSALAFYTFGKTPTIKDGIELAENIIKSRRAEVLLNKYIEISNEV
jgi:anthranilate phosphoribosyltransferase